MVILKKGLKPRTLRFLQTAELVGGPGHGWATRFAKIVDEDAKSAAPGSDVSPLKISVSRIHNLLGGNREVTRPMEELVARLAERAATQREYEASALRKLRSEITDDLLRKDEGNPEA